jgi:ADP-ribose pyrophosphatase
MTAGHEYTVGATEEVFAGGVFRVVSEQVLMPGGELAQRDIVRTAGACAVVALDNEGQVVLIRQYRHAVRAYLWEIPAGIHDVPGESALDTARRELAEEVDLRAETWHLLLDLYPSPGYSNELIRIYLARGLSPVDAAAIHERTDEEADLTVRRVPLDDAVAMVLRGEISNGPVVAGILATARARDLTWTPLRPA